jgi:hypothetical protein
MLILAIAFSSATAAAAASPAPSPPAGRITGLVVDESGRPIEAFRVLVHNPTSREPDRTTGHNFAAPDGRFAVEDVGEGDYLLHVSAPDLAATVVQHVDVADGGTTDVGTVRLAKGGIVRGLVVDARSAPVSGATASVSVTGRGYIRPSPQVTTDARGAFEVRGVSPGVAQVTVAHPAYAPNIAIGLEIDPAKGPVETRVVITQGGRIEGRVRTRSGVLPAGASVGVSLLRPAAAGWLAGPMSQPVASDGTFVVEHIPAGRVTVMLLVPRQGRYNKLVEVEGDVREAETTPVEMVLRDDGARR